LDNGRKELSYQSRTSGEGKPNTMDREE